MFYIRRTHHYIGEDEWVLQEKFSPSGDWITALFFETEAQARVAEGLMDLGFTVNLIPTIISMRVWG